VTRAAPDRDADWLRANQAWLSEAMAGIKQRLAGESPALPPAWPAALDDRPPALERLARAFELSPFEAELLLLCAAFELDPEVAPLCVQGRDGTAQVTFGLALAKLGLPHWTALAPSGPLRRWRLIEMGQGAPLTLSPLRIDETVLHALAGVSALDPRLAVALMPLPPCALGALPPSQQLLAREAAAIWRGVAGDAPVLVQLVGEAGDCRAIAAAAAGELGLAGWVLSGLDALPAGEATDEWARLWARHQRLGSADVLLLELDAADAAEEPRRNAAGAGRLIGRLSGRVALSDPDRVVPPHRAAISLEVGGLSIAEQRETWEGALRHALGRRKGAAAGAKVAADLAAAQFTLGRSAIEAVAVAAAAQAPRDDALEQALPEIAWDICRARSRGRLDGLATRAVSTIGWDDLVLPEAEMATLQAIAAQLRQRMTVYERWGFAAKSPRGLGVSALFAGPSGTGKTMAAEVLANVLRLDLYRIDLSSVVSKYIGETEKNLSRVFAGAQQSGAVLLFDEADALFGKRSEGTQSLDRYSNIEVSYLLQQMEDYRGLAVLTTNMKAALDPAFLRRLRFVVRFPFPDSDERLRIWSVAFPPMTPTQDLDYAGLAQLKIAGGNIRSIALNAAFLAAADGQPVRMSHLRTATRIEYAKLERNLTAGEMKNWV